MYKTYQNIHDKNIFAERSYEYISKYLILNKKRVVILTNIEADIIEKSNSWKLIIE